MAQVALSLGSNLGDSNANLDKAIDLIQNSIGPIIAKSSRFETTPFLHPDTPTVSQRDYLNMAILVNSSLEPIELLNQCQEIEQQVGRDRASESIRWQPRILDIDIILIDDMVIHSNRLIVPHERLSERMFVLEPLHQILPTWRHPVLKLSVSEMIQALAEFACHEVFMDEALALAHYAVDSDRPRPTAAVIVVSGKIIGEGVNQIEKLIDPTAHAEIVAIRDACRNLGRRDLHGAILYTTSEPCPMCLAAIYYSGIKIVYFGLSIRRAALFGFADEALYSEISKEPAARNVKLIPCREGEAMLLFKRFSEKCPGYKSSLFRSGIIDADHH
jgi:2-amino-4-hydroxy-6-hydroxymethyldihydropteridine diphosphokinase